MTSRPPVLSLISGELEGQSFFKTCSATSSMSLISWSCVLIFNIAVNLVSFAVQAEYLYVI